MMFEDDLNDSIFARGLADALACQDLLERVPPGPGLRARARACIAHAWRWLARRAATRTGRSPSASPTDAPRPAVH